MTEQRDPFVPQYRDGKLKVKKSAKLNAAFTIDHEGGDYVRVDGPDDNDMTVRTFPFEWSFGVAGDYVMTLMTHEGVALDSKTVTVE